MDIKKTLTSLKPYQVEPSFDGIRLDANETNNFLFRDGITLNNVDFHRYPDHHAIGLRDALSQYLDVDSTYILEGNGSSELIELIIKTYAEKDELILSFEPTFSMYRIYSTLYGTRYVGYPLHDDYSLDVPSFIDAIKSYQPKIVFLCTPNNPTGRQLKKEEIQKIIQSTHALFVIDEAYIEFADQSQSLTQEVISYDNVIVLRTFSKAFGLASIRLGYMIANENIIDHVNRVKSPYHLNQISQIIGIEALNRIDRVKSEVNALIERRERLYQQLLTLPINVYPSSGNFLFIKSSNQALYEPLLSRGIRIRAYQNPKHTYRITIGTKEENEALYQALKEILS